MVGYFDVGILMVGNFDVDILTVGNFDVDIGTRCRKINFKGLNQFNVTSKLKKEWQPCPWAKKMKFKEKNMLLEKKESSVRVFKCHLDERQIWIKSKYNPNIHDDNRLI
jgi:hypothetical protein